MSATSSSSTYFRVRLINVPAQFEDVITGHSFEYGATGVTEALNFRQPDLTYDPDLVPARSHDIDVYFSERPGSEYFDKIREWAPHIGSQIFEEENKDWLAEWKKGFVPFQLVGDFWVVPSWLEAPKEAKKPIIIDPGMAFGTGTHATTKMASYFVNKLCASFEKPANISLIDVGTGTGILAMLAAHYKLGHIMGIEIDPEARRVARENIKLNNFDSEILIGDELVEEVHDSFDVVVANIIDGVLIQIKDSLFSLLAPGGHIFLTGILLERETHFLENFVEGSGLETVRRIEKDEWVGFWLKRP
jgi:ribosomal protein L11 methyltransferase